MALYEQHPRVDEIETVIMTGEAVVSAINLGESLCRLERDHGRERATQLIEGIRLVVEVDLPDWELVVSAARVKAKGGLSYPDAFCVATAQRRDAPLYTGDPEILALRGLVEVVDLRAP